MLLDLIISLSLLHKLAEIAILGGDKCHEVLILEHVRAIVLVAWNSCREALLGEFCKESL